MRKQIFKNQYQRQLDKIYRRHSDIIVRAKHPVDFSGSTIVPIRSFDDMVNLEEELKTPIVANEISSTVTEFMIVTSDIVYRYTLSDESSSRVHSARTIARDVSKMPKDIKAPLPNSADSVTHAHSRKQIVVQEPSLEENVKELDKKPPHTRAARKK